MIALTATGVWTTRRYSLPSRNRREGYNAIVDAARIRRIAGLRVPRAVLSSLSDSLRVRSSA